MGNIMGTCIGWRFTTNFFFNSKEEENMSFSRIMKASTSPEAMTAKTNVHFEFVYEQKDNMLCLKFG